MNAISLRRPLIRANYGKIPPHWPLIVMVTAILTLAVVLAWMAMHKPRVMGPRFTMSLQLPLWGGIEWHEPKLGTASRAALLGGHRGAVLTPASLEAPDHDSRKSKLGYGGDVAIMGHVEWSTRLIVGARRHRQVDTSPVWDLACTVMRWNRVGQGSFDNSPRFALLLPRLGNSVRLQVRPTGHLRRAPQRRGQRIIVLAPFSPNADSLNPLDAIPPESPTLVESARAMAEWCGRNSDRYGDECPLEREKCTSDYGAPRLRRCF